MAPTSDPARDALIAPALGLVESGSTIGLGSGRAIFALCEAIGKERTHITAVVASDETAVRARAAGITVIDLDETVRLDIAFDGADEIDPQLRLIKGLGAALLREKLVIAAAKRLVILAQEQKLVERLGQSCALPVEVVQFGRQQTRRRLQEIAGKADLRESVVTDEGHCIVDVTIPPEVELDGFSAAIKSTLGVVEHGLFLGDADEVIVGHADGSTTTLRRSS